MKKLLTRNIFLDTQVFKKYAFNLETKSLKTLQFLCSKGSRKLFLSDIVISECESHLKESVGKALNGIKEFKRHGSILRNIEDKDVKSLFCDLDNKSILANASNKFLCFIKSCNAEVISCESVSPKEVFSLYFKQKKPFGSGKKKSEFPDAFSLKALENRISTEKIYVISGDKDSERYESESLI